MLIGYARVSTPDQSLNLQKDALLAAGCEQIFDDIASGAKADRPGLAAAINHCRKGDTLVVWKLDRLGRSLPHLVATVRDLLDRKIGFKSLQESLDTTTSGGKLIFHIFASLAEFERDIIQERTNAGLAAARARGRKGGRPKGVDEKKKKTVLALAKDRERSVKEICEIAGVSRNTYYKYLREAQPEPAKTTGSQLSAAKSKSRKSAQTPPTPQPKVKKVNLWLRVENNSKFIRGKTKARAEIEQFVLSRYAMEQPDQESWEYILSIPYMTEDELDRIIHQDILVEAGKLADRRNCFIEADIRAVEDPERGW